MGCFSLNHWLSKSSCSPHQQHCVVIIIIIRAIPDLPNNIMPYDSDLNNTEEIKSDTEDTKGYTVYRQEEIKERVGC